MLLVFAIIGRLVVYGVAAYLAGVAVVWTYIIIALLIAGGPTVASIGG